MQQLIQSKIKKIKRRFGNTYSFIAEYQLYLFIAQSLQKILSALKNKKEFSTAYIGTSLFPIIESLSDVGFIIKNPLKGFFGHTPNDISHPYNPLKEITNHTFDVVFIENSSFLKDPNILQILKQKKTFIFNLQLFSETFKKTLQSIRKRNFETCLHPNKLAILALMSHFCPIKSFILEVGSYQCGTTIFLAKLLKLLNKQSHVFALDSFEGMPPATDFDKIDKVYYDSGTFQNNFISLVSKRIKKENVANHITLIKGNVTDTLPTLIKKEKKCDFMFLDTDQYKGTQAGLWAAHQFKTPYIIIDDTSLSGVDIAIKEFLKEHSEYTRSNLITNFDLVFNKNTLFKTT